MLARLVIIIFIGFGASNLATGVNLYRSRAEVLMLLGGKEDRLHFSMCIQSTNTESCTYAIDSSVTQEASQCARTDLGTLNYWIGFLENPAYITKVTILNSDPGLNSLPDSLSRFVASVDRDECIRHASDEPLSRRTFGCDKIGTALTIFTWVTDHPSIMTICDVEVMGVPLKFLDIAGGEVPLAISGCTVKTSMTGDCPLMFDNSTSTCSSTTTSVDPKAVRNEPLSHRTIFTLKLAAPSIVNAVYVTTDSPEDISVHIDTSLCNWQKEINGNQLKVFCSEFGGNIEISRASKPIKVCEVQVLGHESDAREPTPYAYLGCFREVPEDRDLPQAVSGTKLTVDKCYKICKRYGFKYFGLYDMRFCYCGFTHGKHGKLEETFGCEAPCDGDGRPLCGRGGAISEYEILG